MTPYAQAILASMLELISPGQSIYSQIPVEICDKQCQQTPLCDNLSNLRCSPPRFSKFYYENNLQILLNNGLSSEKAMEEARLASYIRPENYEEGLIRYAVIAQAMANVSEKVTLHLCKEKCSSEDMKCHKNCLNDAVWKWSRKELIYMTLIATNQESGFRSDVQSGTGSMGRGDCKYKYSNGKPAAPGAKGAIIVPGSCRSVCLGQINLGKGKVAKYGWQASDLLGLDMASTERCLTVVALNLSRSRGLCTGFGSAKIKDWAKATFAAYGSGNSCVIYQKKYKKINNQLIPHYAYTVKEQGKIKVVWDVFAPVNAISKIPAEASWPALRSTLFWMHFNKPRTLNSEVISTLEELRIKTVYDKLVNSNVSILKMLSTMETNKTNKINTTLEENASESSTL